MKQLASSRTRAHGARRLGSVTACAALVVALAEALLPSPSAAQARVDRNAAARGGVPGVPGEPTVQGAQGRVEGMVVRVTDGDSLWIKPAQGKAIEVRVSEIDAPESCQAGGPEARVALRRIAMGKTATLEPVARDRYGRTVGRVRVGGLDLGPYMVTQGHAWSQRGAWGDGPLVQEERAAKAAKRGLHAAPNAILPSEFRQKHGSCYAGHSGATGASAPLPRGGLR